MLHPGQQLRDGKLNHMVDKLMDNLQVILVEGGYDPVQLPNSSMGFSNVVS